MAELATGAVTTLLGVISHEAVRLGRVRRDVQFIQEEMESMGSFLANLSGSSREHDEQVRTWMNQVRILANDCNNCIDLYLYRGDPGFHRPRGGLRLYLWWAPWLLRKLLAQHRAAGHLRELKDRAQDIGNRRLRYGVEVKTAELSSSSGAGVGLTEPLLLPATQDHEEDDDDQDGVDPLKVALSMTTMSMTMDMDEYFRTRLDHWIGSVVQAEAGAVAAEEDIMPESSAGSNPLLPCIVFVVTKPEDADALGRKALAVAQAHLKRVEDAHDKVVPPDGALAHQVKAVVPSETNDSDPLVHQDKAAGPSETKDVCALANEDNEVVPSETKDTGTLRTKTRQCHWRPRTSALLRMKIRRLCHPRPRTIALLCIKIRRLCHRRPRTAVPPETKDVSAPMHEAEVDVPPETKDQEKTVVPPMTKDAGAYAPGDKAMPLENKDVSTPVHQDKVMPPETKHTTDLAHEDKVVPPEINDTSAVVHEDKVVPPETIAQVVAPRNVVVLVDMSAVHFDFVPLRPYRILCYILRQLNRQQGTTPPTTKWGTYDYMKRMLRAIKDEIKEIKVDKTIEDINCNLVDGKDLIKPKEDGKDLEKKVTTKPLGQLLSLLIYCSTTTAAEKEDKKKKSMIAEVYDVIIKQTAKKLKRKIEAGGSNTKQLKEPEYEDILWKVFPRPSSISTIATNGTPGTLVEDEIKDMVKEVKGMLHELRELDKSEKNQETGSEPAQTEEDYFKKTIKNKKEEIEWKITKQLMVKRIVEKIQECLGDDQRRILVILKVDYKYVPKWEKTRKTLGLLECPITGAVIVATKTTQQDTKQYFHCPEKDLVEYSLVGLYLDTVLQHTSHHMNDDKIRKIVHNILCECKSDEFCMKIFAHALYAKPKRSSEELSKLHGSLQASAAQKSLPSRMFKFSYRDLPKEYRSCLLYLAIFPLGEPIRRSTLIGRWVAEGLITTKEWHWSSSVEEADKCFDTLVARCLVCPAGIGATGTVKSCTVHKTVYGFITKIAMKQHILETRLSHHLAHHFSIFSDVRLRSSQKIENFLEKSSQFSKLKVLDLEGCDCFPEYQHYLRNICRKMLMLKYLCLRRTNVTELPSEINNLLELEVLDIRQTNIPASATRHVLLRKLKRLLAGNVDSSPVDFPEKIKKFNVKPQNRLKLLLAGHVGSSTSNRADFSSVQIPEKIEKMEGVEVLSNVKPKNNQDLKDIGSLNQLKKLGVAINKESDLQPLLEAISDLLTQSLRFLSITLDIPGHKGTPAALCLKEDCPNVLERLSINESTGAQKGQLLKIFCENGKQLAKVTLTGTLLSQEDLKVLAELENLLCLKLRHNAYTDSKLVFNKGKFKNLENFLVEGTSITEIKFDNGAASKLERIIWSFTKIDSLSGIDKLPALKELELNGDTVPNAVKEDIKRLKSRSAQPKAFPLLPRCIINSSHDLGL
ncbi:uncharacterized protein [Aegilops tauschii subsp. strangulata]|nr:uncharacterized protein LOC109745912 [Aegilops tauschii subsp. strangulata]